MARTDHQVLEQLGYFTFAGPLNRPFYAIRDIDAQPFFAVALKTLYTAENLAASVRVNGTEIGKVAPRPWGGEYMVKTEHVFFPFDYTLLSPPPGAPNVFEIVNAPGPSLQTSVLVRHVVFYFRW
jgi:hypothetical protein